MSSTAGLRKIDRLEARQKLRQGLQVSLRLLKREKQHVAIALVAREGGPVRMTERLGSGAKMVAVVRRFLRHAESSQGFAAFLQGSARDFDRSKVNEMRSTSCRLR